MENRGNPLRIGCVSWKNLINFEILAPNKIRQLEHSRQSRLRHHFIITISITYKIIAFKILLPPFCQLSLPTARIKNIPELTLYSFIICFLYCLYRRIYVAIANNIEVRKAINKTAPVYLQPIILTAINPYIYPKMIQQNSTNIGNKRGVKIHNIIFALLLSLTNLFVNFFINCFANSLYPIHQLF